MVFCLCVSPSIGWRPIQDVPHLSPLDSGDKAGPCSPAGDKTGIEKVYKFTTSTIIYKCTEKIGTVQFYMTRLKIDVFVGLRISTEDTV